MEREMDIKTEVNISYSYQPSTSFFGVDIMNKAGPLESKNLVLGESSEYEAAIASRDSPANHYYREIPWNNFNCKLIKEDEQESSTVKDGEQSSFTFDEVLQSEEESEEDNFKSKAQIPTNFEIISHGVKRMDDDMDIEEFALVSQKPKQWEIFQRLSPPNYDENDSNIKMKSEEYDTNSDVKHEHLQDTTMINSDPNTELQSNGCANGGLSASDEEPKEQQDREVAKADIDWGIDSFFDEMKGLGTRNVNDEHRVSSDPTSSSSMSHPPLVELTIPLLDCLKVTRLAHLEESISGSGKSRTVESANLNSERKSVKIRKSESTCSPAPTWRQLTIQQSSGKVIKTQQQTSTPTIPDKLECTTQRSKLKDSNPAPKPSPTNKPDSRTSKSSQLKDPNHKTGLAKAKVKRKKFEATSLPTWRQLTKKQFNSNKPEPPKSGPGENYANTLEGTALSRINFEQIKSTNIHLTCSVLRLPTVQLSRLTDCEGLDGSKDTESHEAAAESSDEQREIDQRIASRRTTQEILKTLKSGMNKNYACDVCDFTCRSAHKLEGHIKCHKGAKPFLCPKCPYRAKVNQILINHLLDHSEVKPFACDKCKYKTALHYKLKRHRIIHEEPRYACELCDYKSNFQNNLRAHMRTHSDEKPYACDECNFRTAHPEVIGRHKMSHTGEKRFSCDICDYRCSSSGNLTMHMLTHSDNKPHACDLCVYRASTPHGLMKHRIIHSEEMSIACDQCDYRTRRLETLKRHKLVHHNAGEKPFACHRGSCNFRSNDKVGLKIHERVHTGEKPYACKVCGARFAQWAARRRHYRIHTGETRFECNYCDYKTAVKHSLQAHMRTHTGERPFACSECDSRFSQQFALNQHMKVHTGEKPYSCDTCDYKAAYKSNMAKHQLSHTGEKAFACEICDYKTAGNSAMKMHMRVHAGIRPYACDSCDFRSSSSGNLKTHMRSVHAGELRYFCAHCDYKTYHKKALNAHVLTNSHSQAVKKSTKGHKMISTAEKPHKC